MKTFLKNFDANPSEVRSPLTGEQCLCMAIVTAIAMQRET